MARSALTAAPWTRLRASRAKATVAGLYMCNACRKQFTVTVGTLFERSHIPLNKWLLALYLLMSSKKGMSTHQMHRMLASASAPSYAAGRPSLPHERLA
jgi:transposase-like protein